MTSPLSTFRHTFLRGLLFIALLVPVPALWGCGDPPPTLDDAWPLFERLKQSLSDQLQQPWSRGDGFTYAVDVGHLMWYAAVQKDKPLYEKMRAFAVDHLIQNNPQDEYTQGFVLWRFQEGTPGDASGTTEALRVAEGLWEGYEAFGNEEDKQLAILITKGYGRHAFVDQGIWLIRNYFNMQTRAFVTNSYLVDYDPDFLATIALATKDEDIKETAMLSRELVKQAVSPAGLIYSVVQPEVATLLPKSFAFFSPNDTIKLFNTATVAERVTTTIPSISRKVLAFALDRKDDLHQYYLGATGERPFDAPVGSLTYTALIRIALRLNDKAAATQLIPDFLYHAKVYADNPYPPKLYTAGELLMTFHFIEKTFRNKD